MLKALRWGCGLLVQKCGCSRSEKVGDSFWWAQYSKGMCFDLFACFNSILNWSSQLRKCHCLKSVSSLNSAYLSLKFIILSRKFHIPIDGDKTQESDWISLLALLLAGDLHLVVQHVDGKFAIQSAELDLTKKSHNLDVFSVSWVFSPLLSWRIVLCLSLIAISWQGRQAGLWFWLCLGTWILWRMLVICSCQKGHWLQVWALKAEELLWEGACKLLCLQLSKEKGQESCAEGCGRLCTSRPLHQQQIQRLWWRKLAQFSHSIITTHPQDNVDAKGASLWGLLFGHLATESQKPLGNVLCGLVLHRITSLEVSPGKLSSLFLFCFFKLSLWKISCLVSFCGMTHQQQEWQKRSFLQLNYCWFVKDWEVWSGIVLDLCGCCTEWEGT